MPSASGVDSGNLESCAPARRSVVDESNRRARTFAEPPRAKVPTRILRDESSTDEAIAPGLRPGEERSASVSGVICFGLESSV